MTKEKIVREKPVPEHKLKQVKTIAEKMKNSGSVLIASMRGLPASQFQKIKKSLRGKAEITVAKRSIVLRAIDEVKKGALKSLKEKVGADVVLIFSDIDAFELAGILMESQSSTKAKAGDIAPEDINVEPGPTELMPGPAISELGSVGLKVVVENGKLAIKKGAVIVKAGDVIKSNVASVMGKLNIEPIKVGFVPIAAYDGKADKFYSSIKIDKAGAYDALKEGISKALGFAVHLGYVVKETLSYFIAKASMEEKALTAKIGESGGRNKKEESKVEDEKNE